ncbi:MAG: helix-turn-helix transcriptional regulator [Burkholderiales bacterium]|nr:helix-turn-helix transcriptional regulator [Burkholderiales bacterium]
MSKGETRYEELFAQARTSPEYWAESMAMDVVATVCGVLGERGWTQADLARAVDKHPAYISRCLAGPQNLTLRTIAELLTALDLGASIEVTPLRSDRSRAEWLQTGEMQFVVPPKRKRGAYECLHKDIAQPANGDVYVQMALAS